jgi:hypothetical protein
MKLQIPIIACLLVALPAAALADPPHQQHWNAPRDHQYTPRDQHQTPQYQDRAPMQYRSERYVQHDVQRDARPWEWNGGRTWVASPRYWGGGFWGAFSVDLAFNNYPNGQYYEVQPSSPGSQLLQQYGLQQTDCDQPNLVDIAGPDGGEVCAYPNNEVAPGQYQVDPSTLTLISE